MEHIINVIGILKKADIFMCLGTSGKVIMGKTGQY